jgi:hypothetical protein
MTNTFTKIAFLGLLAGSMTVAHAVPILTLFNTGVNAAGVPLADNSVDPHYTVSGPFAGPNAYATTSAAGYPVGPWIGDSATSAWLAPSMDTNGLFGGVFTYTTTFNLAGLSSLSALITGRWAADDGGGLSNIILNGTPMGISNVNGFSSWTSFSLSSGFKPGLNTLAFQVENSGGGPTGVRVEMTGSANSLAATPAGVPDNGPTAGLLGLGLLGVETLRRRLNKRRTL